MIGTQRTGRIPGVHITGTTHEGLIITANGQPAQLAIVTADGRVLVAGTAVADEVEAATVNLYQRTSKGLGHLRELAMPQGADQLTVRRLQRIGERMDDHEARGAAN